MNGHTAYKMVVKVVSDLGAVGEILEEVETEEQRLVLDMRALPEEEMQVFFKYSVAFNGDPSIRDLVF